MRKYWNRNKKRIPYAIGSVALFLLLFFTTFPVDTADAERQSVQMVCFGDSVFGLVRDETAVPAQVASRLNMTFFNAAFGGTQMARGDLEYRLSYGKDTLSLVGLMKAIEGDDFGVQQAVSIRESSTEYFAETIDALAALDFSGVELILIQQGQNDYYSGVPIANEEDPYDEYTFTGALRTSLSILRRKYPDIRIVLVTPSYSWYFAEQLTCEEFDAGYGVLEDYVQAEMEVAQEFGVELIDVYHGLFTHEEWADWERYTEDGLHPNEAARALIAEKIVEFLQ